MLSRHVGGKYARKFGNRALSTVSVDNPFTRDTYCTVDLMSREELSAQKDRVAAAQAEWKRVPVAERIKVCEKFMEYFDKNADQVCRDITGEMGKPLTQSQGEIRGMKERTIAMMDLAPKALEEIVLGATTNNKDTKNFHRSIVREPVGIVLTLAPYNFPLLTAVNSIVPAVLAGNGVVVNHGFRTPLISQHFAKAFEYAGVPKNLVSAQTCSYENLHAGIREGFYDFVSFTGSIPGGRAVNETVGKSKKFIDCTLELGGNDGVYVADDADLDVAVATAVDGALYNAGQSCCGVERVFVHESLYDSFVEKARAEVLSAYGKVGDPTASETNVGPMAQPQAVPYLVSLVQDAKSKGAQVVLGGETNGKDNGGPRLFTPTLLASCGPEMLCMTQESFGPLLAVQKVSGMEEAVKGINKSNCGLTGIIFTNDQAKAEAFADQVEVGTVFMNRSDYLDPYMPWQGRKETGKGLSLSQFGFHSLTKLKNHHFKFLNKA